MATLTAEITSRYGPDYAKKYIDRTLTAPYTQHKNATLAGLAREAGVTQLLDIGSNVNPSIKQPTSLRYQAEQQGISYFGLDVSESYFDRSLLLELGVNPEHLYFLSKGVVGDGLALPFKESSIEGIVCADVIEHVADPRQLLAEISRVLRPGGHAFIVIPSMYKLDMAHFAHVLERRASSHETKLHLHEWQSLWSEVGLHVDHNYTKPLGLASGATYFSWLADNFIPKRESLDLHEEHTQLSILHAQAKKIIAQHDAELDALILNESEAQKKVLQLALNAGEIIIIFEYIREKMRQLRLSPEDMATVNLFFDTAFNTTFNRDRREAIAVLFKSVSNPLLLLGNSIVVALQKT